MQNIDLVYIRNNKFNYDRRLIKKMCFETWKQTSQRIQVETKNKYCKLQYKNADLLRKQLTTTEV